MIPVAIDEDPRYCAFRWWRVYRDDRGLHLTGWFYDIEWAIEGWTKAGHLTENSQQKHPLEPCPAKAHHCGLYAWRTLSTAHGSYECAARINDGDFLPLMGIVKVAGKLIFHGSEGARAQYARPLAFAAPDNTITHPLLGELNERMGLPIFSVPEYTSRSAAGFPTPVRRELPTSIERYATEFGVLMPTKEEQEANRAPQET